MSDPSVPGGVGGDSANVAIAVLVHERATARAHAEGRNAWWIYVEEILGHQRLPYRYVSAERLDVSTRVALVATAEALDVDDVEWLRTWVEAGGQLVLVGDPGPAAVLAGVEVVDRRDRGHVEFPPSPVWTQRPPVPLHAVGGVGLGGAGVEVLASWSEGAGAGAATLRRLGRGSVVALGVDLWQTVVLIQQGQPVTEDGVPASDGTAPVDDDILKAEDGLVLDVETDRQMPPSEPAPTGEFAHAFPPPSAAPMFHEPHADHWRSVLLQLLWWAADLGGDALPWLDYWPAGVPAVAHMSHDADLNDPADARAALEAFAEAGVRVTWCQVYPGGYGSDVHDAITAAGHENALHYNAMGDSDIATWGRLQLRAQYAWAQAVTGTERIVSNKNHYTRWEGWTEFYRWCEEVGIQIDQSRGPSKLGTTGFPFGTAHVSFPMGDTRVRNRRMDVLNLPLHSQDLGLAAHLSVRDVILDATLAQHGVAHFLFHGTHLRNRPQTRQACTDLVRAARRRGMEWWTSAEINAWERARRGVELLVRPVDDDSGRRAHGWEVRVHATAEVAGAAILIAAPADIDNGALALDGAGSVAVVVRHGRRFIELTADLAVGEQVWTLRG
jgi:hypothetical protein